MSSLDTLVLEAKRMRRKVVWDLAAQKAEVPMDAMNKFCDAFENYLAANGEEWRPNKWGALGDECAQS